MGVGGARVRGDLVFGFWFLPTTVRRCKSLNTCKPEYLESCFTAHVVEGILSVKKGVRIREIEYSQESMPAPATD